MRSEGWGKMPNWWQSNPDFHRMIREEPRVGIAIAALKLYVDLCCRANFVATELEPVPGTVRRPLPLLATSIGVSKPTLIAAIRLLEKWGLIRREPGKPQALILENYGFKSWTKMPARYLRWNKGAKLKMIADLPSRGVTVRNALQLYLYIASIRNRGTGAATVTYSRIAEVIGCSTNDVSRAVSLLCAGNLITVRRPDQAKMGEYACNIYTLLGSGTTPLKVDVEKILLGSVTLAGDEFL
jgi:hypothetical protein